MELDRKLLPWFHSDDIVPYVFIRKENRINKPGTLHKSNWFHKEPMYIDALKMRNVDFANEILNMEAKAFAATNMPMPRWVFYDCAIVPGFVAGFAMKRKAVPTKILEAIKPLGNSEWLPISLFIIIPGSNPGEWVAHNLCSFNSLVEKPHQFSSLGFLSKAFALWYANISVQVGMTQWTSPALKLHCNYGKFEILTSYTPVHSYATTLTYRLIVDPVFWPNFFKENLDERNYAEDLVPSPYRVDPRQEQSLIDFQSILEKEERGYYLNAIEILNKPLGSPYQIYQEK